MIRSSGFLSYSKLCPSWPVNRFNFQRRPPTGPFLIKRISAYPVGADQALAIEVHARVRVNSKTGTVSGMFSHLDTLRRQVHFTQRCEWPHKVIPGLAETTRQVAFSGSAAQRGQGEYDITRDELLIHRVPPAAHESHAGSLRYDGIVEHAYRARSAMMWLNACPIAEMI